MVIVTLAVIYLRRCRRAPVVVVVALVSVSSVIGNQSIPLSSFCW
jgi:hypothetical protein